MDIKTFRLKHKLTQQELSGLLGVTNVTLCKWENGAAKPRKVHLEKLKDMKLEEQLSSVPFRPIQYLGSKLKLLRNIETHVENIVSGDVLCDLFCGSGVVSNYMSHKYKMIACDVQEYSSNIVKSLLSSTELPENWLDELNGYVANKFDNLSPEITELLHYEEEALRLAQIGEHDLLINFSQNSSLYINMINPVQLDHRDNKLHELISQIVTEKGLEKNQIFLLYGSIYFSYRQSLTIDFIRQYVKQSELKEDQSGLIISSLLSSSSDIVNTVGKQFAQPMKMIDKSGKLKKLQLTRTVQNKSFCVLDRLQVAVEKFKNSQNTKQEKKHEVYTQNIFEFLELYENKIDCFYADPPYTIDHYSRFYHVLETIAKYDNPELAVMNKKGNKEIMNGLYRVDRHQSDFCVPSLVKGAFEKLFAGCRKHDAPLILSYSPYDNLNNERPRLMTQKELFDLALKYYSKVSIHKVEDHIHRKLHSNKNNVQDIKTSEIFMVCEL
jgi:adenine-specific DNA methylase